MFWCPLMGCHLHCLELIWNGVLELFYSYSETSNRVSDCLPYAREAQADGHGTQAQGPPQYLVEQG
jgi:hypothetical protein